MKAIAIATMTPAKIASFSGVAPSGSKVTKYIVRPGMSVTNPKQCEGGVRSVGDVSHCHSRLIDSRDSVATDSSAISRTMSPAGWMRRTSPTP
jgi:hypothetical protein